MSTISLTAYEHEVAKYADQHGLNISKNTRKGIAKSFYQTQRRLGDLDLERVFMHADPTPPQAFRNIADNGGAAARRLGLVGA